MAINPIGRTDANPVTGTSASDNLVGTAGVDVVYGYGGNDILNGGDGNDRLYGGNDNDRLVGSLGEDINDGGPGSDTVDYQASPAGIGVHLIENWGTGGTAQGDTFIYIENVIGSAYNDWIHADDNPNDLYGKGGNDYIYGRGGNDLISGGSGDDNLHGDAGDDVVNGDFGNDVISGGTGADVLNGGAGIDMLSYAGAAAVKVDLLYGTVGGGATGDKISYFENVTGSSYDDQIKGANDANELHGGFGNDILEGRGGTDLLGGGFGNDTLTGGADADVFQFFLSTNFTTGQGPGHDQITDYQVGIDQLALSNFDSPDDISIAQVGSNTVITFNHVVGSVTLVGVNATQLVNSDWLA